MQLSADIFKYKTNRNPNYFECNHMLFQKEKIPIEPQNGATVIELNSNYMETIDWRFDFKGLNSAAYITFATLYIFAILFIFLPINEKIGYTASDLAFYSAPVLLICISIYMLCQEAFSYTHYPIRLDRKSRMIHVFRRDGSVLSAPWESIFFCMSHGNGRQNEIQGHVFHEGTTIIRETFCFARTEPHQCSNTLLLPYWEFIRRYMEDGPDSIIEHVHYCPVIAQQYENIHTYWQYRTCCIKEQSKNLQIMLFLPHLVIYPFRWFAMKTSKIPVWPEHIQQQCVVDPDDPYIRNANTNRCLNSR